jgi:hypothetical protein
MFDTILFAHRPYGHALRAGLTGQSVDDTLRPQEPSQGTSGRLAKRDAQMIHTPRTRRRPGALEWLKERTIDALATVFRSRSTAAEKSRCITLASCFGRQFPRVITTAILNDSRTRLAVPHEMPSDSFLCGPAEFALTALSSASHLKPMKRSTHWAASSRT